MFIRFSSRLHMSSVSFPLSNHTSILLSLLISILLLAIIRAALLFLRTRLSSSAQKQALVQQQPHSTEQSSASSSWGWGLLTWDNLPTLPMSLKFNEKDMNVRGVGLIATQKSVQQSWQPARRGVPAFEHPPPAMYQSEVPVSMAKMIMSRHTFRKPTQRPPSRPAKYSSQMQYTRRPASMV